MTPFIENSPAAVLMCRELEKRDLTAAQWAKIAGIQHRSACRQMKRLHDLQIIHVADWYPPRVSGPWTPVYRIGYELNAKKPKPLSKDRERVNRKQRERWVRRQQLSAPCPLWAPLFALAAMRESA